MDIQTGYFSDSRYPRDRVYVKGYGFMSIARKAAKKALSQK